MFQESDREKSEEKMDLKLKLSLFFCFCFFARLGNTVTTLSDVNANLNHILLETLITLTVTKHFKFFFFILKSDVNGFFWHFWQLKSVASIT